MTRLVSGALTGVVIGTAALVVSLQSLHAQQSTTAARPAPSAPQQSVFRSTVEIVPVDVVVVDQDGNPVRGLAAADFTVRDRGTVQRVSVFEEVSHDRPDAGAPPPSTAAAPAPVRHDVANNRAPQMGQLVVLVVDDLHIYRGRTDVAKDLARQVVRQIGPQASMAVLFTSGTHSTQVTGDQAVLLAALDTLKGRQSWRRPHSSADVQTPGGFDPEGDVGARTNQLSLLNSTTSLQDFYDNMSEYKALQDAARMLTTDDTRRKAFVMLSEGINKDLTGVFDGGTTPCETNLIGSQQAFPPPGCYHDIALSDMMTSLRRSNVAVYNLDPRGHVTTRQLALEDFPSPTGMLQTAAGAATDDDSTFDFDNPVRLAQHGLEVMAEASGGFAVTNTDDFATGIKHIYEDITHYYLLGFYPTDPAGKGFRPLDVTVTGHPDWTLRFRKGYLPPDPTPGVAAKNTDPLTALASGLMPKTDLPLRVTAIPIDAAGKLTRVAVALEVTTSPADLRDPDGKLRDELRYELLAADVKHGKVTATVSHDTRLALAPAGGGPLPETLSYQVLAALDLAPGTYQLRASATSAKLGKGGSVYLDVDVPDLSSAPLTLSGLVVGSSDTHVLQAPEAPAPPPVARGRGPAPKPMVAPPALPFAPSLDREFTPADSLRLYVVVGRRDPSKAVQLTVEVLDRSTHIKSSSTSTLPPHANGGVGVLVPLHDFSSGVYTLRVTASDGSHTASRDLAIAITGAGHPTPQ